MSSTSYVIYIGITNDLVRRVEEHKNDLNDGFTKEYKTKKLVYYEYFKDVNEAIRREKQLKKFRRSKKVALIEKMNPRWNDLYNELLDRDSSSAAVGGLARNDSIVSPIVIPSEPRGDEGSLSGDDNLNKL